MNFIIKKGFLLCALLPSVAAASTALPTATPAPGTGSAPAPTTGAAPAPAPSLDGEIRSYDDGQNELHQLVAILDYVAADYPAAVEAGRIVNESEFTEQTDFVAAARELLATASDSPEKASVVLQVDAELQALAGLISALGTTEAVRAKVLVIRRMVVEEFGLLLSPSAPPSLKSGHAMYLKACAECHGHDGNPPEEKVKEFNPPPRSLLDPEIVDALSPYRVFNTTTFGIEGTDMPSFEALPARDRWDLAFYVLTLRHADDGTGMPRGPAATLPDGTRTSLPAMAALTDAHYLQALRGAGVPDAELLSALAKLRMELPYLPDAGADPLSITRRLLDEAILKAASGDRTAALGLLVDAYLEGFERAEPALTPRDPGLVADVEQRFLALRAAVKRGAPLEELEGLAAPLRADLGRAEGILASESDSDAFAFFASMLIFVREGVEAALLVATLLALVSMSRRTPKGTGPPASKTPAPKPSPEEEAKIARARRYVHAGWIAAVVAGIATWLVARVVVQRMGSSREMIEAVVSLLAAAVLFYVSFWLLSQLESQRWMAFIKSKVLANMGGGRLFGLAGIAFLAAYREAFETILFYEALLLDHPVAMVAAGAAAGVLVLVLLIFAFLRIGRRLPMKPFFAISGVLLYTLCVVLTGHGLQSLREAGALTAVPIAFPRISWLGMYPDLVGLSAQAALVAAIALAVGISVSRKRRNGQPTPSATPAA